MPKPDDTCYMCELTATSDEHVPPKCIFPERKDLGVDFRKNLFTVPSCDEHNSDKSHLDVLLMRMAASGPSNEIGRKHAQTKVFRDFKRNVAAFNAMIDGSMPVKIQLPNGRWQIGQTLKFDEESRRRAFDHLARALYFHWYGEKWLGEVVAEYNYGGYLDVHGQFKKNSELPKMLAMTEVMFQHFGVQPAGENPSVFFYRAHRGGNCTNVMIATFYGMWQIFIGFGRPKKNA